MDREEFENRVMRCRGRLMAVARRRLPADECEDAVQSAILSAWEHLPQLRRESAFEAWLTQILVNQCRQILRQQKKDEQTFRSLQQSYDEAIPEETRLGDALDAMQPAARSLLLMRHGKGFSIREMAQELHTSEDAVKMRLHRARRQLRILLLSLLLLLLLGAAAIGTGVWDVRWFLNNRRASPPESEYTDYGSAHAISYNGLFLVPEIMDVKWDTEWLELLMTYSLAGTDEQALTVHSGCIGVDGERLDHIWINGDILPVEDWAQGKPVHVYTLDGWRIDGMYPVGSEDFLADGLGESFFSCLSLDMLTPELYAALLDGDGMLLLQCSVVIWDYASRETLETGELSLLVCAPDAQEWRDLYEAYIR